MSRTADQAEMVANRTQKNARHLRKWARRERVTCYRIYDKDIPEVPLAIDWYDGRLHVAEYRRSYVPEDEPAGWLQAMAEAVAAALEVPADRVFLKTRERQRGSAQYERVDETDERTVVEEGGHSFYVNLTDYLDTGLFLDHRTTRARVGNEAEGTRFLNLFCYTGAFTVYATAGGARDTTSVDLSRTYIRWAKENMVLNDLSTGTHRFVCADALAFLDDAVGDEPYDLVVLDPPTFSNSKKMTGVLDTQRDHAELINKTLRLMRPGGVLYFSSNNRRFKFDMDAIVLAKVEDISAATIPPDFRNQRIHHCWRIIAG